MQWQILGSENGHQRGALRIHEDVAVYMGCDLHCEISLNIPGEDLGQHDGSP